MKYYMAPLEGITGYVFRNAHYDIFHPADKYFTPFITPGLNSRRRSKALRDVLPENNKGPVIIPQILTNRADEFLYTEGQLAEMGYTEINLNLGCPSGTVVGKKRGSGLLAYTDMLDRFLDEIYEKTTMKISIKTRLGKNTPEEFETLMEIYNRYPLEELIIHPRTREDYYKGTPRMEMFQYGFEHSRCPVCYNGDIFTKQDVEMLEETFPSEDRVMIGRGLISNPALLDIMYGEVQALDKERLLAFHNRLYEGYEMMISGEINLLYKMKEVWTYMITMFKDSEKYGKKIRKAQRLNEYHLIVNEIFTCLELCGR